MSNIYMIQPAFTTGEISPAVGSRVDLDKYKSALLNAENTIIRPYGGCYRRQGSQYIGELKYSNKDAVLVCFYDTVSEAYLLEVGWKYIRIWDNGAYTGIELVTPYEQPKTLQFTQSGDIMFICSGTHPVKELRHTMTGWELVDMDITEPYYDILTAETDVTVQASNTTGSAITLTASADIFFPGMEGGYMKLTHAMPNQTVSLSFTEEDATKTSDAIYVGEKWKIITHGTHHSKIILQKSDDKVTWKDYRTYTSNDDQNYTESGSELEGCWMRVVATMWNDDDASNSKLTIDLSRLPYTHEGTARITKIVSARQATGTVQKALGSMEATKSYAFSSWNSYYGYPTQSCFFQDRFVLAANARNPYSLWMSRTGDYNNFSVEKVDGNITDDSAIKLDLIVRNSYLIRHLIPSNDLVILTSGNEWIISGDTVITPGKCNPKAQTMRGSSTCLPQHIGNRIIHVQRSGSTVRDLGYQYDSDNYNGDELDILATHLVKNHSLISSAYCQEPDSNLYFVRDDGVMLCLTIIREQSVFAWSHLVTDGKYQWIVSIPHEENDELYTIVERVIQGETKRYIECIHTMTDDVDEYVDAYVVGTGNEISLPHLIGKTVQIVGDGIRQRDQVVPSDGIIHLEESYERCIAGLAYTTKIEQPAMEINLQEGTLQGRIHKINAVTLRLEKTYGGRMGLTFDKMDELVYDEPYQLFTGDLIQHVPLFDVGANSRNHLCMVSDDPYPFKLNAIIKEVSIDGGMVKSYNGPAYY